MSLCVAPNLPLMNPSMKDIRAVDESPRTPERRTTKIDTPSTPLYSTPVREAPLATPARTHFASWVDEHTDTTGTPDRTLRRELAKIRRKSVQSVLLGSAEKDMEKIRTRRKRPSVDGTLEITPQKAETKRRCYKIHPEVGPEGRNRIFPTGGPNVITMSGSEYCDALKLYQAERSKDPSVRCENIFRNLFPNN